MRPAGPEDTAGGVPVCTVVEPASEEALAGVLRCANDAELAVVPRGGGTKLEWGNPPSRADVVLSTARLNRVAEHAWADMTATVEAGCTVGLLQETLAQHGQRLAVDVLWPDRATVGGILATNDSGALRLRYGGLRDLIIGVTMALADGTLAASGGKVVKNVAGYDLPKLATGALGTLGVIAQATFRLHPLPPENLTLSVRTGGAEELQHLVLAIQDSHLAHTAIQARLGPTAPPEVDILLEGTPAGIASQEAHIRELATPAPVLQAPGDVWAARQELWSDGPPEAATVTGNVKLSILPSDLAHTAALIARLAGTHQAAWRAVVQATGIGWLRLEAAGDALPTVLSELRAELERKGGSLVVARQPRGAAAVDAWGSPGDAFPVMRALKQQLDPRGTLNPGRFVGGI